MQRQEFAELLESGTLRKHALEILEKAYRNGVRQVLAETGLPETVFAADCPLSLEAVLSKLLEEESAKL